MRETGSEIRDKAVAYCCKSVRVGVFGPAKTDIRNRDVGIRYAPLWGPVDVTLAGGVRYFWNNMYLVLLTILLGPAQVLRCISQGPQYQVRYCLTLLKRMLHSDDFF